MYSIHISAIAILVTFTSLLQPNVAIPVTESIAAKPTTTDPTTDAEAENSVQNVSVTEHIIEEKDKDKVPVTEEQNRNSIDYAGMMAEFKAIFEEFSPDVYDDMKQSMERIIPLITEEDNPTKSRYMNNGHAVFNLYEDMYKKGNELSEAQRIQMFRNCLEALRQMYLAMLASEDAVQLMMKHLDDDSDGIIKSALAKLSQSLGVPTETLIEEFKNHKSMKLSRDVIQQLLKQMFLAENEDDNDSGSVESQTGESKDQPEKQSKDIQQNLQQQKQKHLEKEEEEVRE